MKVRVNLWVCLFASTVLFNSNVLAEEETQSDEHLAPTFVVTNFVAHDNSYFSFQEAIKFTELLQLELMEKTSYDWVDRERVEEALKELKLTTLGLVDNTSSLQIGRWLKADLLIKGDFYRHQSKWWLIIETIDLDHADIIGQFSFYLDCDVNKPLSFLSGDPAHTTELLVPELKNAINNYEKQKSEIYIAPLFFQNKEPGGRLDFFEEDLRKAFAGADNPGIRFLQFPRSTESIQESELVALGLVESDPDSWEKLADYYVWGSYEEVNSSGLPFKEVPVKATITIWNGLNQPIVFNETETVSDLSSLSENIINKIIDLSQAKSTASTQTSLRSQIAQDLTERARDTQEFVLQIEDDNYPNISNTWWKRRQYSIQLLSTASFFDPDNKDIRTRLLVETSRDDIDNLIKVRPSLFWRKWARSNAWQQYCDKFGLDYELVHMPELKWRKGLADNRLFRTRAVDMYIYSVLELVEECEDHETRRNATISIPENIPTEVVQGWKQELSSEFVRRLDYVATHCPDKLDNYIGTYFLSLIKYSNDTKLQRKIIEVLWDKAKKEPTIWHAKAEVEKKILEIYSAEGNIERGKELIAMLPQEDVREVRRLPGGGTYITTKKSVLKKYGRNSTQDNTSQQKETPQKDYDRFGDKIPEEVDHNKTTTIKISDIIIPNRKPKLIPVSLEKLFGVQETTSMEYARNCLWTAVRGQKMNRQMDQGSGILLYDFQRNRTLDMAKIFGDHSEVTSMLLDGTTLWLTFSADGIWAADVRSLNIKKYTDKDGLPSNEMYCSAAFHDKLFFCGGIEQKGVLCAYDKNTQEWIRYDLPKTSQNNNDGTYYHLTEMASDEKWIALYSHYGGSGTHILIFNVNENKWFEVGKKLLIEEPGICNFGEGKRLFVLDLDIDSHGLWISTSRGIALLDLKTMEYVYKCLSTKKVTASFADNRYMWIACVNTPFNQSSTSGNQDCHVLCFEKESKNWIYNVAIPYEGKVDKMLKIENVLWLGMSSYKTSLISVECE